MKKTQNRPDLIKDATEDDARSLRKKIAKMIYNAGLECGMSITSYKDRLEDIQNVINDCKNIKEITYLLVTLYRDFKRFSNVCGDVRTGFCGKFTSDHERADQDYTTHDVLPYLKDKMNLTPFGYIGSNKDSNEARWVSYLIANFYPADSSKPVVSHSLKASMLEKLFLKFQYLFTRKYPFYQKQDAKKLKGQLKLNGLMGGDFAGNNHFLKETDGRNGDLNSLRVLVQNPAELDADGTLRYCENCPDAVIKNGKLVPVCISDRVE